MSEFAAQRQLHPAGVQLPVDWYADPDVYLREQQAIFAPGPHYVGHALMVPEPGDYHTLAWMDHARTLVRNGRGVELLSNVCRHRQALLLEGRGRAQNIVCPVHHWTYDLSGALLGAPHFGDCPQLRLEPTPLTSWKGLLFAGTRDVAAELADFGPAADFDFSGHVFDHADIVDLPFNWKTFLEIYLELYHVEAVHPGVRQFVDPGVFRWQFGEHWSNQVMGVYRNLRNPGTPAYARYQEMLLAYRGGKPPKYGTQWSIYYPDVMMEWYPEALVISHLIPRSPTLTTNVVEFYYPEEVFHFERELVAAHQSAYLETSAEDAMVCTRIERGLAALRREGRDDRGPYQSPLEDGVVHLHEWIRARLGEPAR